MARKWGGKRYSKLVINDEIPPIFSYSKGTQEVGSCLKKFIDTPVKKLILWSDSCGGQNRSIKLILLLIHMLQNSKTTHHWNPFRQSKKVLILFVTYWQSFYVRYLQSGHSFLPNDSEFGDVECVNCTRLMPIWKQWQIVALKISSRFAEWAAKISYLQEIWKMLRPTGKLTLIRKKLTN